MWVSSDRPCKNPKFFQLKISKFFDTNYSSITTINNIQKLFLGYNIGANHKDWHSPRRVWSGRQEATAHFFLCMSPSHPHFFNLLPPFNLLLSHLLVTITIITIKMEAYKNEFIQMAVKHKKHMYDTILLLTQA